MYLGIEIGGTKLQLGVGSGDGRSLVALERAPVDPLGGAQAIRQQIAQLGKNLIERYDVRAIGVGFGGPVDAAAGRTIKSHQVDGWDDFPLVDWCREHLGPPAVLGNDSDLAGLGEARFGAGQGGRVVFYSNIGSGIGGALVIDGKLFRGSGGVASELGHLRPGPHCERPDQTVESIASGWAIAAMARRRVADPKEADSQAALDLLRVADGQADRLTTVDVTEAAAKGNPLARAILQEACRTYGWAIAQMITLLAPDVVVIGGGVSLVGEELFLGPLRCEVDRYVFPPLRGKFKLVAAELGEEVVVHGALALAAV
ncbi:MAG: ROK family protein [Thermoguttaceae bacterium]